MAENDRSQENGREIRSYGLAEGDAREFLQEKRAEEDILTETEAPAEELSPEDAADSAEIPQERSGRGMAEESMAYGDPGTEQTYYGEQAPAKPKKRRKRRKKHPFLNFFIFVLLCVGCYFTLKSQLFTVTKIDVEGNRFYTKAQIIELSGLRTGYNLFEVQTRPARDNLLSDPYIKYCKIDRVPRGTIRITVEERTEYAAVPYGDEYVLLDEDGLVLRISDTEPVLPLLMGMSIIEMTPGSPLQIEQSYLLPGTLELISIMDENDLYFKKIYFSTVIIRAYIYDNYYFEGTPANIIANMQGIRQLLEEHYKQGITRGVIKVGNNNYLAFSPQIQ